MVVTLDWAMKFLPRKYREGTIDWFGKRGLNWHIAVTLMKRQERFKTVTHIHIFREQTTQDAATTLAVIADVVADLKEMVPDLGLIHLFSDNAGCYKSSLTILSLHRLIGTHLASYNFCESQNGKGKQSLFLQTIFIMFTKLKKLSHPKQSYFTFNHQDKWGILPGIIH